MPDPNRAGRRFDKIYEGMQTAPAQEFEILKRVTPSTDETKTLSATYRRPYQMHASIGPRV